MMTGTSGTVEVDGQTFPVLSWEIPEKVRETFVDISPGRRQITYPAVLDWSNSIASIPDEIRQLRNDTRFNQRFSRVTTFNPTMIALIKRWFRRAKRKPRMRMLNRRK